MQTRLAYPAPHVVSSWRTHDEVDTCLIFADTFDTTVAPDTTGAPAPKTIKVPVPETTATPQTAAVPGTTAVSGTTAMSPVASGKFLHTRGSHLHDWNIKSPIIAANELHQPALNEITIGFFFSTSRKGTSHKSDNEIEAEVFEAHLISV